VQTCCEARTLPGPCPELPEDRTARRCPEPCKLSVKPGTRPELARNFRGPERPAATGASGGRNVRAAAGASGGRNVRRRPELPGHEIQAQTAGTAARGEARGGGSRARQRAGRRGATTAGRGRAQNGAGRRRQGRPRPSSWRGGAAERRPGRRDATAGKRRAGGEGGENRRRRRGGGCTELRACGSGSGGGT
jgi:hypothetical protein